MAVADGGVVGVAVADGVVGVPDGGGVGVAEAGVVAVGVGVMGVGVAGTEVGVAAADTTTFPTIMPAAMLASIFAKVASLGSEWMEQ